MTSNQVASARSRQGIALAAARGYPMFFLLALSPLIQILRGYADYPLVQFVMTQLTHESWHGCRYIDMGFAAFVLTMGISIPLVIARRKARGIKTSVLYRQFFVRALFLFLLGVIYNGGFKSQWPDIRIAGVLQRLSVCYLVTSTLYLHTSFKSRIFVLFLILIGYWALLEFVSVPGYGAGNYSREGNLAAHVDRLLLPGKPFYGDVGWDPEGILPTISVIATCLVGVLTGDLVFSPKYTEQQKVLAFIGVGWTATCLALIWSEWMPINKPIWTPPFVLLSGGITLIHFAVVYQITVVWKKNWLFPFTVVGLNPLLVYFLPEFVRFDDLALRLVGGDIQSVIGVQSSTVLAITEILLPWGVVYWMYGKYARIR